MSRTSVGIALAAFNGERFLAEQLETLAQQTRLPDELMLVDDASSDGTRAILEGFQRRLPDRVRVVAQTENGGPCRAFAAALRECRADVIFLCDQDDLWRRDKVARFVQEFEKNAAVGLVASDSRLVNERGKEVGDSLWRRFRVPARDVGREGSLSAFRSLVRYPFIPGHAMAIRRRFLEGALPIPEPWTHDEWLAVFVTAQSRGVFLRERLTDYRLHQRQAVGATWESLAEKVQKQGAAREALALDQQLDRVHALQAAVNSLATRSRALPGARELVDERRRYISARRQMREARFPRRVAQIAAEAAFGRYWRVGRGALALARDLLFRRGREPAPRAED